MSRTDELAALAEKIRKGGAPKYHQSNAAAGKLFCRERIALLCDDGGRDFVEDGLFANAVAPGGDLPADGVVTGTATIDGRAICLMANDSTIKAGSWGARTVEKIIRIIETAYRLGLPMVYLVDSAGARITDQVAMFPGRRGAGKIFHSQVRASGSIFGHGVEASFPLNLALAAQALRHGALYPPGEGDERLGHSAEVESVLVTGIGHRRGEALALLTRCGR